MKILELQIENVKRIKAIDIKPDGQSVTLGGENGAGKSSAIASISYTLEGTKAICDSPIRSGEKDGKTRIVLGEAGKPEFIVTRKFTAGGSVLVVKNKDGDTKSSPQKILDGFLGHLSFDPLAFSRMEAKPQRDTLAKLAGLDFAALDAEYQRAYDARTDANRDAARIRATMVNKTELPNVPAVEVSSDEIMARLDKAQRHNQTIRTAKGELQDMARAVADAKLDCESSKQTIEGIELKLAEEKKKLACRIQVFNQKRDAHAIREKEVTAMVYADDEPIRRELSTLTETNAAVRANAELRKKRDELAAAEKTIATLNAKMESVTVKKSKLITDAKYPLDGLTVSDEAVLFRGIPIKQASSAEQIKISAAIAMALNPKLRVMLIKDGAYLDSKSLAALQELALKNDVQLWIERVGTGDEVSVIIEDGAVKENRMLEEW